jgi:hypothetical protein
METRRDRDYGRARSDRESEALPIRAGDDDIQRDRRERREDRMLLRE